MKIFIGLLTGLVNGSNHTKCISLSSQKCMIQSTLINLHPNEYSQEFHYYPFLVKLDRWVGSCNTLNNLFSKVCIPDKIEDLNLSASNLITGINESKTLTKHISCKCNVNLMEQNVSQINDGITINVDLSVKTFIYEKKNMFGILVHVFVKMDSI